MRKMSHIEELATLDPPFWNVLGTDWIDAMSNLGMWIMLPGMGLLLIVGVVAAVRDKMGWSPKREGPPSKILAVLVFIALFSVPVGMAIGVLGYVLGEFAAPLSGTLYVVNGGKTDTVIKYDGKSFSIPARTWGKLETRTAPQNCNITATLGSGSPIDKACPKGLAVLNLSSSQKVGWHQVKYMMSPAPELLKGPARSVGEGLWPVVPTVEVATYSFAGSPPIRRTVREDSAHYPVINLQFMD